MQSASVTAPLFTVRVVIPGMDCSECGAPAVAFHVPDEYRDYSPEGSEAVAICTVCLALYPADGGPDADDADFTRIIEAFPGGEAGVGMALAVGLLVDSLALNRDAVGELLDHVADRGADPWLVIERLAVSPTVDPDADLERLRRQLEQLLR